MKYKLEIWKYDIFDADEAEKHLNRAAGTGWELVNISQQFFPLALYRRNPYADEKLYSVKLVGKDEADYFQLCKDAGWELKQQVGKTCVFYTADKDTKPLYSDLESEYQNILESGRGCGFYMYGIGTALVFLLLFGMFWLLRGEIEAWDFVIVAIAGSIALLILAINYYANYFYFQRALGKLAHGMDTKKPRWLKVVNGLSRYCLLFFLAVLISVYLYKYIWYSFSLLGIVLTVLAPVVFLAGYLIRNLSGRQTLGNVVMAISGWVIICLPSLVNFAGELVKEFDMFH